MTTNYEEMPHVRKGEGGLCLFRERALSGQAAHISGRLEPLRGEKKTPQRRGEQQKSDSVQSHSGRGDIVHRTSRTTQRKWCNIATTTQPPTKRRGGDPRQFEVKKAGKRTLKKSRYPGCDVIL